MKLFGWGGLRTVMASERAECGLACLAMVANRHGHDLDLAYLRQFYPISSAGTRLEDIMNAASELGLASRALKVELEALPLIDKPAILHWNLNHFVVLERMVGEGAVIHDPASGRRQVSAAELSDLFTGVVLELEPRLDLQPVRARQSVKLSRIWAATPGLGGALAQIVMLSLAVQILSLSPALLIQFTVDRAISAGGTHVLLPIFAGFVLVTVALALLSALRDWAVQFAGAQVLYKLTGGVYSHMLRLPAGWFEKRQTGDVLSRVNSLGALKDVLTQGMASSVIDGLGLIVSAAVMFLYSPLLAFLVLVLAGIGMGIGWIFTEIVRQRTERSLVASAREQSFVLESMRAISTIKVMGKEPEREHRWRNLAVQKINADLAVAHASVTGTAFNTLISGLQPVLVLGAGALLIFRSEFTPGMAMAFFAISQIFSARAMAFADQLYRLRLIQLHLERVEDILLQPAELLSPGPDHEAKGKLELRSVSFRYGKPERYLFSNLHLCIEPGEFVAIVGPSGAGKSTLIKLMLGMAEPESGEVLLDGRTATPPLWRAWRKSVGVVSQEDALFSGTIYDNITFFSPDADFQRVRAAAEAARIDKEVEAMPMRYQTSIGDMGSALSAGQKQRLLLARALFRAPKILLLDEGTANLDDTNEGEIIEAIRQLPITRVMVTHKMELASKTDRVLVVRDGGLFPVAARRRELAVSA